MSTDARGRKVAVVADSRLEALLPELAAKGYGTIQLPPAGLEDVVAAAWLEQVAEHVAEFLRSDYEVVIAGDGSDEEKLRAYADPAVRAKVDPRHVATVVGGEEERRPGDVVGPPETVERSPRIRVRERLRILLLRRAGEDLCPVRGR